jgi:formylglycine-generating enzyme required for sulfatase activity
MKRNHLFIISILMLALLHNCNSVCVNEKKSILSGMRQISGGTFQMVPSSIRVSFSYHGDSNDTSAQLGTTAQNTVTIPSFYMDTTVVTQGDYKALIGVNPSQFTGDIQRPVENVTWFDAVLYCNARSKRDGKDTVYSYSSKIIDSIWCRDLKNIVINYSNNGYRLPTDVEWEYACRVGATTPYLWGDTLDDDCCWTSANSHSATHPVAMNRPNAWGLYDMVGNVRQWCNDWYGSAPNSQTNTTGTSSGIYRVDRGGSWVSDLVGLLPRALRSFSFPGERYNNIGFRCVRR